MKFLLALVGLVLLGGGVYLSLDSFLNFMALEPSQFGLTVGLSFLGMVLGLYFIFSVFSTKKPKAQVKMEEEFLEQIEIDRQDELEEAKDEVNPGTQLFTLNELVEAKSSLNLEDQTQIFQRLDLEDTRIETDQQNHDLKPETILMPRLEEETIEENTVEDILKAMETQTEDNDTTTETLKGFYEEESDAILEDETPTHTQEARLIGIEPWGIQRILRKLKDGDEVELRMNAKHGLRSAEIFYTNKSIGYLSKVDFIKIEDHLPNLLKIKVATIVSETKAIDMVILRLIFKNN